MIVSCTFTADEVDSYPREFGLIRCLACLLAYSSGFVECAECFAAWQFAGEDASNVEATPIDIPFVEVASE